MGLKRKVEMTLRAELIARRINRREERAVRKTAIPAGACSTCWAPSKHWLLSKRSTKDGLHCRECGAFRSDWVNPKYTLPTENELARRQAIAKTIRRRMAEAKQAAPAPTEPEPTQPPTVTITEKNGGSERKRKRWEQDAEWMRQHDASMRKLRAAEEANTHEVIEYGHLTARPVVQVPCPRAELLAAARAGDRYAVRRAECLYERWR
jgi:hypothetical protein